MNNPQNSIVSNRTATLVGALLGVLLLASPRFAQGAIYTWDAGGDGATWDATQTLNWSSDTVPGSQDTANLTLPSVGAQAIAYNTALYPSGGANLPRTVTIGNTGGGTTTLTVSQNFYTYVANSTAANAVNINSGGVWKQTAGTAQHNDNILINGGELLIEGGTFYGAAWPAGNGFRVSNGGTINVTGGRLQGGAGNFYIGYAGSGSLTMGADAVNASSAAILQVGNGTTGSGTVNWNMTGNSTHWRSTQVNNGVFNLNANAGELFHNNFGLDNLIQIGTGTGTAVFNKNNAANLGGDASVGNKRLLWIGTNGTMNWGNGNLYSNQTDQKVLNQGVFNYTRASGTSNFKLTQFENDGTFNWDGAAALNLYTTGTGNGDFQNDGFLVLTNDGQVTLQGALTLSDTGTFDVSLGTETTTGLLAGNITLGGALEFSELAGFQMFTNYDILSGTISGSFDSIAPGIVVVDNGLLSGTFTIYYIPEPASLGLLALGALALVHRRRR